MSDPGIVVVAGQGGLTIAGISLSTPAWWTLDLSPLWEFPETRGENITIPGRAGKLALRRWITETVYQVPMHITGAVNQSGAPYSDPVMGLATNLDYLWTNVATPPSGATRAAVLTMPNASTRSANVQVQLVPGPVMGAYDKPAVLFLTVSTQAGRFA